MQHLRNVCFSLVLFIMLCGPFGLWFAEHTGITLPSWFTMDEAAYLSGGTAKADVRGNLSLSGFGSKALQEAVETAAGNHIPMKGSALIANATLQRSAISLSNELFGWDCYPTYDGSSYIYCPALKALGQIPSLSTASLQDYNHFCDSIESYSQNNPNQSITIFLVDMSSTSASNPAMQYVQAKATTSDVSSYMKSRLSGCQNVRIIDNSYVDPIVYYDDFFKSDHHWNARGAFKASKLLLSRPMPSSTFEEISYRTIDGPPYSGAFARSSLCLIEDTPFDFADPFESIVFDSNGETLSGEEHPAYYEANWLNRHFQFYDLYYNFASSISNTAKPGDGNAVIICDSFGGALLRPVATSYDRVSVTTALHASTTTEDRLTELCGGSSSDPDVYFIAHPANYISFNSRNPYFFETENEGEDAS